MAGRIALTLVTGFLGAGKTTLINRLLKDPALADTAVIVNEFGAVGIDHLLVEQSSDGVIELSDGCLCCTVRGALVETLEGLGARLSEGRIERLKRVVIETTGLADPIPVLQALAAHPDLSQTFRLDGVVTVVDALHGLQTLDAHEEAGRQVAVADRLVLSKVEDVDAAALAALMARLDALAPGVERLGARQATALQIIDCSMLDAGARATEAMRSGCGHDHHHGHGDDHHHHHHHHHGVHHEGAGFDTVFLGHDRPMPVATLENFLDLLRSQCGARMLRLKGIVETAEAPERPLVVQGVRQMLHSPRRLDAWPDAQRGVRLVIIGTGLDAGYIEGLFAAFTGQARVDMPDRAALEDNPLAIAGFRR
ncbi:CobW family GTP-binding protein [Nitratireductor pacificus]|uniref:Cobalamin synthesis protein P47K n=1 Tax=Nitratireductor pacificus pht-3B TaxID=391937 RepID=K2MJ47_9HYPH|nr:GTP-binding protein [Nitratireductor pacificus]EKF17167.1 cobalamin synthesis protein P47K [Nitratireductor pacificus pht-3B]